MAEGWIKLYRKITEWEWYTVPSMAHLFIHLLFIANQKDKKWKGIAIKRGQLITSANKLVAQTGLSKRTVIRDLARLTESGEIAKEPTRKYTLITIKKFDKYQSVTFDTTDDTTDDTQHKNIKKVRKKELSSSSSSAREGDSEKNFYDDMKGSVEMMKRLKQDFGLPPDRYWSLLASYDRECIAKGVQHASMNDYKTRFCDWVRAHVSNGSDDYKQQMLSDASWSETMCMKYRIKPPKLKEWVDEFFLDQQCRGHQSHEGIQDAKSHFNSWLMIKLNKENNNGSETNKQISRRRGFDAKPHTVKEYEEDFF